MTSTRSPTATAGGPPVKTKMPSDVSTSPSLLAVGVCMKKPSGADRGDDVVLGGDGEAIERARRSRPLDGEDLERRTGVDGVGSGDVLQISVGVAATPDAVRAALVRVVVLVAGAPLVDLGLAGVEQRQQAGVVGIGGVVDQGVDQVSGRDRGANGEVARISDVEGHGVGPVLQPVVGKNHVRRDGGVAVDEVTVGVGDESVEVEGVVSYVAVTVEEDDHQAVENRVATPPS